MAKISTYPIASPVSPDDLVIGTSNLSEFPLQTKNFKISEINALGSTPIPVAVFSNTTDNLSIPLSCETLQVVNLSFNNIVIEDITNDIQKVSNTKIKLVSGGIYSFELRYCGLYLEEGVPVEESLLLSLPIGIKDYGGGYDYYNPPLEIYKDISGSGLQQDTNNYMSWTKVYLPNQEVDFNCFLIPLYEIVSSCSSFSFRFSKKCIDEFCISSVPGLELTVKRFRQLTVEEYLKYAEAVGEGGGGVVPA